MAYTFQTWCEEEGIPLDPPATLTDDEVSLWYAHIHELWWYWNHYRFLMFHPTPKQKEFLSAKQALTFLIGRNRGGKSIAAIAGKVGPLVTGMYPDYWPDNKRFTMPTFGRILVTSIDRHWMGALWKRFQEWMPHWNDPKYWEIRCLEKSAPVWFKWLETGSIFDVVTHEVKTKTLESAEHHWIYIDEPAPHDKHVVMMRGILDQGGEMFTAMTPVVEAWYDYEVIQKTNLGADPALRNPNYFAVRLRRNDNPYLPKEHDEIFADSLKGMTVGEQKARLDGEMFTISGLVYPEFMSHPEWYFVTPFVVPPRWPRYMMMDPHDTTDWHVLWATVAPNGQRFYYDELVSKHSLVTLIGEIRAKEMSKHHGGVKPCIRIVDYWAFSKRKTEANPYPKSLVDHIQEIDPSLAFIKSTHSGGSIEEGRLILKSHLEMAPVKVLDAAGNVIKDQEKEDVRIKVFANLVNLREALRNHSVDDQGNEKQRWKHFLDCMRWLELYSGVGYGRVKTGVYSTPLRGMEER